eukprot:Phypoly_transcript_13347.p1 GENE.Phypoly_transcript_13347~~Phypoly_transcript_13347.p1  ORF type:complete len:320 (+),score=43.77 Phypoly_transcript_13347:74-1033(+)
MSDEVQCIVVDLPSSTPSSWDDFEKLLHHGFYNELRIAPEEHLAVFSESVFAHPANREKLTQILFETFNVPLLKILPTCSLSVFASGAETGVSIHAGETSTEIVPVISVKPRRDLAVAYPISGSYITGFLQHLVADRGFTTHELKFVTAELKKKLKFSLTPENEPDTPVFIDITDYVGSEEQGIIKLDKNSWLGPEMFMYPELASVQHMPLAESVLRMISKCPEENQRELLNNIVLSGGVAEITGLKDRLQKDLTQLLGDVPLEVKVKDLEGTTKATEIPWVGGSIMGSLTLAEEGPLRFMSKDVYDEFGPTAIHQFCV